MLKEHCGCGQKTDFDENDETRENYVTTWEVCWSLCQTSQGTSLEGKQHIVQEKFLDFKSFCSLKIGAVPPEAPVYWMVAFLMYVLGKLLVAPNRSPLFIGNIWEFLNSHIAPNRSLLATGGIFDIDFQVSGQVCENRNNIKSRST